MMGIHRLRVVCASALVSASVSAVVAACNSASPQVPQGGTPTDGATPPTPGVDAAPTSSTPEPPPPPPPPPEVDAGPTVPAKASFKVDGVATWRGDATAAYSIIHDDICDPSTNGVLSGAEPELAQRGLHAGFGVIVSRCEVGQGATWAQLKTLLAHGHDVFSHSLSHLCMTNDASLGESCDPAAKKTVDYAKEIGQAGSTLKSKGFATDFFIFPYDVCDPVAVAKLKADGYLGARCGTLGTNTGDFPDPFKINFDVFGASYSQYFGKAACAKTSKGATPVQYETTPQDYSDTCRQYILNHYVDDIIAAKGYGERELHGMDPVDTTNGGWETVSIPDYRVHLDYIVAKAKAGALWVEGPTPVIKYRFARETKTCALPKVTGGSTLHFEAPSADCQKYGTVLSYKVSTADGSDPADLKVKQGSALLPAKRVSAGHFVVDADPTKGDAVLVVPDGK